MCRILWHTVVWLQMVTNKTLFVSPSPTVAAKLCGRGDEPSLDIKGSFLDKENTVILNVRCLYIHECYIPFLLPKFYTLVL